MARHLPAVLLLLLAALVTACGASVGEPTPRPPETPRATPRQTGKPPTPTPEPTPTPPPTPTPTPGPATPEPVDPTTPPTAGAGTSVDQPGATPDPGQAGTPGPVASAAPTAPPAPTPQASPTPFPSGATMPGPDALAAVDRPCPPFVAKDFTCTTLTVPLDHFAPGVATLDVTYAFHQHSGAGKARGTLVTLVGGPGASGIDVARELARTYAPAIRARYDLVFLDRRGVRRSGGLDCPDATRAWLGTDVTPADPAGDDELLAAGLTFGRECAREAGADRQTLRLLSTAQAAADLEMVRRHLGVDQLTILGMGEGSLLAQQYAAAHPDAVKALILDSPLDPETRGMARTAEGIRAAEQVLVATLNACAETFQCKRDTAGKDALAAYDALIAQLAAAPVTIDVITGQGETDQRTIRASDLALVAASSLGDERDRMLLLRAIGAASQGRWWHVSRMLDLVKAGRAAPGGLAPIQVEASEAARLATVCADMDLGPGPEEDRASGWLASARVAEVTEGRLARLIATDLPCASWPGRPLAGDPAPATIAAPPYPVVILGSTMDPVAPWTAGLRIATDVGSEQGHTILTEGGPHLTYGRSRACPDRTMTSFLALGREPVQASGCRADVVDPYVPIAAATRNDLRGSRDAIASADREIVNVPDLATWTGEKPLRVGCPFGGVIAYVRAEGQTNLRLDKCAFSKGMPLTGTGFLQGLAGPLSLELEGQDPEVPVTYRRDADGAVEVDGVLRSFNR